MTKTKPERSSSLIRCDKEQEATFQWFLKQKLCSATNPGLAWEKRRFSSHYCDDFKEGLGAVLMQRGKGDFYASRRIEGTRNHHKGLSLSPLSYWLGIFLNKIGKVRIKERKHREHQKRKNVGGMLVENQKIGKKLRTEKLEPRTEWNSVLKMAGVGYLAYARLKM
ncbi:hypothetical protein Tco_1352126 [Tanacetum coccineum]